MKLWILSDLHDDGGTREIVRPADFDVFVCAGDVMTGDIEGSIERIAALAGGKPAVFVAGNHEWMTSTIEETAELGAAAAKRCGVHWLELDSVAVHGVRFAGATLWTPDDARFVPSNEALAALHADVVVTHFPPSFQMRTPPGGARLWICGHHHGLMDARSDRLRIIRNALGYAGEAVDGLAARQDFVVELKP